MNDLAVKLIWNGWSRFTCVNAGGVETAIDADEKSGASPVELLLEALGACASADVVSILEMMQTPAAKFEVALEADRHWTEPRTCRTSIQFNRRRSLAEKPRLWSRLFSQASAQRAPGDRPHG